MNKICKECNREFSLTIDYFKKNNCSKDGFNNKCRECQYNIKVFADVGYKYCVECQECLPKNNDYFNTNNVNYDKFNNKCKKCIGGKYTNYDDGYKTCKECKEKLPRNKNFFHVNSNRKDGYSSRCKNCVSNKHITEFNIKEWYESRTSKFKNNWNYVDILWLYDNYLRVEKKDLLAYFDNKINYKTITNVIYKWGLRKVEKNDDWSKDDIDFLIVNYPNLSQDKLQDRFKNRTWHSIKMKASKLNVHRSEEMLFEINSESHKGHVVSEETKRKMRLSRRGSKNHNWKGGISPIVVKLRDYTVPWKMESLKKYDYKCALSGINDGTLHVHHLYKNFSEITYEVFDSLNLEIHNDMSRYTKEEELLLMDTMLEFHYKYGLGVPLTNKIHKLFHKEYGLKNNNYEQFKEFEDRYHKGEFRDVV